MGRELSSFAGVYFAEPQWVHWLWGVAIFVALLLWLERRREGALDRFVQAPLQARLVRGPTLSQRVARIGLLGVCGLCLTIALMRPQWGLEVIESERTGAEIMISLDVSRSMLAEDVAPNRLERAKAEIRDLLNLIDSDQVGLIAFAGRATVLAPLTPDFGFLRLALDNAGPATVTRGGTRLEEPIRKAIAAFGDTSDVTRSILLITDGEDHDSFPMEAAAAAAERGIRIIAIGFGDEAGSEIPYTDPKSGARTLLRDADGRVVRSRLDGSLLREMALATNGAYIPAGTGQLDLASIYKRHVAPLTRGRVDKQTRTARNDAFQWAVLIGLLALIGAVMSTARTWIPSIGPARTGTLGALAICGFLLMTGMFEPAQAQGAQPQGKQPQAPEPASQLNASAEPIAGPTDTTADHTTTAPSTEDAAGESPSVHPREAYNEGLSLLQSAGVQSPQSAMERLESARANAGTDAETRFRATYNLGWAEVQAADASVESEPEKALDHLHRAAGWFREAVSLRSGNEDARYNLEIVMRRALELADSLAVSNPVDLRTQLEQLIGAQRDFLGSLRRAVALQQATDDTSNRTGSTEPDLRLEFRRLAAAELTVMADAEELSNRASAQRQVIEKLAPEERTPGKALEGARLEAVLGHIHDARQRIGQTRTRLRRQQGERAYRRAAAATAAMQRARDQLLEPAARIDALIADGTEAAQLTGTLAMAENNAASLTASQDTAQPPVKAPAWLTGPYVAETQRSLAGRTLELQNEFAAGAKAGEAQPALTGTPPAPSGTGPSSTPDAQAIAELTQALTKATPLVERAQQAFSNSAQSIADNQLRQALFAQREALESLIEAREYFLDLRRLIELVYNEEQRVYALLNYAAKPDAANAQDSRQAQRSLPASPALAPVNALAFATSLHPVNIERAVRLGEELTDAMASAQSADATTPSSPTQSAPSGPDTGGESQRYEQGYELLGQAMEQMHAADAALQSATTGATTTGTSAPSGLDTDRLSAADESLKLALAHLEDLRRLFFSVLEHLRETALRHQVVSDETQAVAGLSAATKNATEVTAKSGPLSHRQQTLATTAQEIAQALKTQAQAPPPAADPTAQPTPEQQSAQADQAQRLGEAANLVTNAGEAMHTAAGQLGQTAPAFDETQELQKQAAVALDEALQLLQENQPQPQPQSDQQDEQNQQQQQQQDGSNGEQQQNPQPEQSDIAQLLQGVRDREAKRRQERARNNAATSGYEPVEKDW